MKDKVINTHPRRFGFEPLFSPKFRKARKEYECIWCKESIEIGQRYCLYSSRISTFSWKSYPLHMECEIAFYISRQIDPKVNFFTKNFSSKFHPVNLELSLPSIAKYQCGCPVDSDKRFCPKHNKIIDYKWVWKKGILYDSNKDPIFNIKCEEEPSKTPGQIIRKLHLDADAKNLQLLKNAWQLPFLKREKIELTVALQEMYHLINHKKINEESKKKILDEIHSLIQKNTKRCDYIY